MLHGKLQHFKRCRMNPFPFYAFKRGTATAGIDLRQMKNLRSVKIADPGNGTLIEQRNLNRAARVLHSLTQSFAIDCQSVRPDPVQTVMLVELVGGDQPNRPKSPAVPKEQLTIRAPLQM